MKKADPPLRVGINPWPGYQLINLAHELGLYEEYGVEVELVDLMSNGEVNRVYELGYIDVGASTLTDLVNMRLDSEKQPITFYICDYSNGADVIISRSEYKTLPELKGQRIGADVGALDYIHLVSALEYYGMTLDDIEIVPMRQTAMTAALLNREIEAAVTYPPVSTDVLARGDTFNRIFDSSMIPGVIIDILVAEPETLDKRKDELVRFIKAIEEARLYFQKNPEHSNEIMARYSGLSIPDFEEAFSGIAVVSPDVQMTLLDKNGQLPGSIRKAFEMYKVGPNFAAPETMFTQSVLQQITE